MIRDVGEPHRSKGRLGSVCEASETEVGLVAVLRRGALAPVIDAVEPLAGPSDAPYGEAISE